MKFITANTLNSENSGYSLDSGDSLDLVSVNSLLFENLPLANWVDYLKYYVQLTVKISDVFTVIWTRKRLKCAKSYPKF